MNITAYTILNLAALFSTPVESEIMSNPYVQGAGIMVFFIGCNYVRELIAQWRNPYEIVYRYDDNGETRYGKYASIQSQYHEIAVTKNGKFLKRKKVRKIRWDAGYGRQAIERFISNMRPSHDIISCCGYEMSGPLWSTWRRSLIHEKIKELLLTR
jgi:hypothetical protein